MKPPDTKTKWDKPLFIFGTSLPSAWFSGVTQKTYQLPIGLHTQHTNKAGKMAEAASRHRYNKTFLNSFSYRADVQGPVGGHMKRAVDLIISTIALIALAPIMLMLAALIYISMGRPIFFAHERVGYNRVPFRCYKFRSMVFNSREVLAQHLAENPEAAKEWVNARKLRADPRVTPLGKFLRKSSLDELPQLFNIFKGDMSCVGPRPVVKDELKKYGFSDRDYLNARPGLTGLWQVSGRSSTSYLSRVCLDRIYCRRWSIIMDLLIMLKTIPAVLKFKDSA